MSLGGRKGPLGSPRKPSNSGGGDDWLMTYADSITLLMAFFVMLFSISQLDHEKFIEITEAIEKELGQRDPGERLSPSASSSSEEESEDSENETSDEDSFAQSDLVALNDLMSSLDSEGAMVQARPKGFEIELNAKLLYASGSAELRKGVRGTLSKVGEQLMEFGEDECLIEVQGHTDSAPISSGRYASNWELSAARATGVVRFFIDQGLPPSQLRAIAFSDTQPKVMPGDEGVPDAKTADDINRRVVIRVTYLGDRLSK